MLRCAATIVLSLALAIGSPLIAAAIFMETFAMIVPLMLMPGMSHQFYTAKAIEAAFAAIPG
jgi:hypothetical protein